MANSMAEDKNKQEEQTQEPASPFAMHMQELGSIGAEMEALQAKRDARQANINDMQKRINDAKANQMSVLSAFVQQQKPVYDEKKEKRMRNRAMIQAFGDVLSEASKGYFAFRDKGAGVVPQSTPSNALEEVNKISEMQKKYLDEKKAWDTLNMDWQAKKTQADIDAAEALLTKEEKYQEKIEERIEKLRERGVKITDGIRDAVAEQVMKEYNDARETEEAKQYQLWLRENKLGQYAPSKTTSRGGGGGGGAAKKAAAAEKKKKDEKLKIWERATGQDTSDLLDREKEQIYEKYGNDPLAQVYEMLLDEGYSDEDIQAILAQYNRDKNKIMWVIQRWLNYETAEDTLYGALKTYGATPEEKEAVENHFEFNRFERKK